MVDDQLPDEHLFAISVLSPWFADIDNYLVVGRFSPNLSSREKSIIVRKSAPFTWIRGNLFKLGLDNILRICVREEEVLTSSQHAMMGPMGVILLPREQLSKIYTLATVGQLSIKA